MQKINYRLDGLDCANCAVKIQENISKLDGIESAELVFATQNLSVTVKDELDTAFITKAVIGIVTRLEPDVKVIHAGSDKPLEKIDYDVRLKRELSILLIGSVLFAAGLFFKLPFWPEFAVFFLSYLITGGSVVMKAVRNTLKGQIFDENFLMTIATLGAFAIQAFPEAVAVMLFYKAGQLLEGIAVGKSRKSIKSLLDIKPPFANLKTSEGLSQVDPNDVKIGDIVVIKPGERVPLDGIVIEGISSVDTSALTGESTPKTIGVKDVVLSGFINNSGSISVEVTKSFNDSVVSKILDLVQNAASKKAPTEKFITKFAGIYTPLVVLMALLIAVIPPLALSSHDFSIWVYRALVFLVVSCPCALVISIPLSYFGGIGGASRRGILIKGSNYLEALNKVNTVVFDKTGTLTKGVFKVVKIVTVNGYTQRELLEFGALSESHSNHPIAKSILDAYGSDIDQTKVDSYEEIPGCGVRAVISKKEILAGNDRLLHLDDCIDHDTCDVQGTVVHIAVNKKYAGYIIISDQVKDDSAFTIAALKKHGGIRVAMLTGDSEQSAKSVSTILGINEYYYSLLPHEKVQKLEEMKANTGESKLVFVGDGINDAPVLALSDIGISMGGLGSDAAIEASDIVLMTDEPGKIIEAINIARKTRSIVWQNILLALGVKVIVMILGAGGVATMWEAVFADVGVTLLAVFNSLRVMEKNMI